MDVQYYKEEMEKIVARHKVDGDWEAAHAEADAVLCELLEALGCHEVVELYNQIPKE